MDSTDSTVWPEPGDEGFVHQDGTAQAERQLEENRQAAADRAAAGSTVDGAPALGGDGGRHEAHDEEPVVDGSADPAAS